MGKIYLLRCYERPYRIQFCDSLNAKILGKLHRLKKNILQNNEVDFIYSSPILRSVQTITPYIEECEKKIRLDWSLCDVKNNMKKDDIFAKFPCFERQSDFYPSHNIDEKYIPIFSHKEVDTYVVEKQELHNRIYKFCDFIVKKHEKDDILIVSHDLLIQYIGKYFDYDISLKMGEFIEIQKNNGNI